MDEDPAKAERARHRRQLNTAYRKEAEARAQLAQLRQELESLKKPAAPDGAPKLEQFDFDPEKYATAREEFAKKQALTEFQSKQRAETVNQAKQRLTSEWAEKVEQAHSKYEDFSDVVGPITPDSALAIAIMQSDPGVVYHLMKNGKEAQRIVDMNDPIAQAREIGKLEAKLAAQPDKPKTPSRAPAPITPVTGSTAPAPRSIYDPNLDYDTFVKMRNKELGRKSA